MSKTYSVKEDVTLLQAVLGCEAHVKLKTEQEMNPIERGLSKLFMDEVVSKYKDIRRRKGFKFPRRSKRGLSRRFQKIMRLYGVGSYAETGSDEELILRNRLLSRILNDREKYNEKQRRRDKQLEIEKREKEMIHRYAGSTQKRIDACFGIGDISDEQIYKVDPRDPHSEEASPSEKGCPKLITDNAVDGRQVDIINERIYQKDPSDPHSEEASPSEKDCPKLITNNAVDARQVDIINERINQKDPSDLHSEEASPSDGDSPILNANELAGARHGVKKENILPNLEVGRPKEEKSHCLHFILNMLDRKDKRKSRMDERMLNMEETLLCAKGMENEKGRPSSKDDPQHCKLRLEYLKTLLAKRELEFRVQQLEMREKEKMWYLMEKMLG
ncbi:unnamed protein product [Agarophyton chilense]|eukprot:gb/GEZJ01000388.1/.p1 GENE.gb/GEZJ01000388.1/~~gb/GEZJ01000388.1/.p1  ORF type:complete len:388 (-),score=67.22 gb/GEZJ01000388.1/:1641-2804(-)